MEPIPVVDHDTVLSTVSPRQAIDRVREAFLRHSRGEWKMPAKVYLESPPDGDFRAMPALGDGVALVKWVTSFPVNPSRGLPVVMGTILANDATTGRPLAIVDARAVTALRTGASAAVASLALARSDARTVGIIGCGLHGAWAARCLAAAGFGPGICSDLDADAAGALAEELGWSSGSLREALAADVIATVTPGSAPIADADDLKPGSHLNALGADGPGKSELTIPAVARCKLFCDEWTQASHGGELHAAIESGAVGRSDVTEIGHVLLGEKPGRATDDEITLFDSTGLAIQDLAIVTALLDALREGRVKVPTVSL
ncbi:MAG: alanine dehydrogenase [Actinomycetota bacterium]|jgi:ornithine cyclodeaminase/alanine dehydrogenase-like protein (mu-crystallin family)|nr:alanine dehydrogenase [Actinomycetota bacterium]